MASIEEQVKEGKIKEVFVTLIVSSMGFVAALFWRDAIKESITNFVPHGEGWIWSIYSAVIVTIIIVAVIFLINKLIMSRDLTEAVGIDKVKSKAKEKLVRKTRGQKGSRP